MTRKKRRAACRCGSLPEEAAATLSEGRRARECLGGSTRTAKVSAQWQGTEPLLFMLEMAEPRISQSLCATAPVVRIIDKG